MFPILFGLSTSISDEDVYSRIKPGYNNVSLISTKRYFKVESGHLILFLAESTNDYTGIAHSDNEKTELFKNETFGINFKSRGYLEMLSPKFNSIYAVDFSRFKYPSCSENIALIGSGSLNVGCSQGADYVLEKGDSVCVYYAFPKTISTATLTKSSTLSTTVYTAIGDVTKSDNVTQPFMMRIVYNSNTCDGSTVGATVTYNETSTVLSMKLLPEGGYQLGSVGKFAGWVAVLVVISVLSIVILGGIIVASVVLGICCYHCIKERMFHAQDAAQLELGIIEIPPADDSPYESKNPLQTHEKNSQY
ncbi:hypothetical protein TVAG_391860 [Trichomonas vaginalis G3]|uniref:Uncharacterized protein n=1 Tax=Trichomonas vaginalis (strain ATCC PRA-98 / G3) TaxID=412133 RepID=A2DFU9_TRIV3|nr:hypothetical protein TVAGG3_0322660 [Trichomonas vaginalis G3]EAY20802.1 hypothetical protein TVAG_391860 [Trichomonas vaginalis G3]KAI5529416.1 hypothetical protein TVAGG3_0322660 [Trichomonas vaginalis G3]|eukprot:XP_001581788.1 hypothetical protein [Trichomonas vaginalis G3]